MSSLVRKLQVSSYTLQGLGRALFLFLVTCNLILVAACGFTPLYDQADGRNVSEGLNRVDIAIIPDQKGVYLRNLLIDQFYHGGYPANPAYELRISPIQETITDLDITIDSEATRQQIRLDTTMTLTDKKTGQAVLNRALQAISSSNILGSQFTNRVSEQDSREAALGDLARQIELQTALYFEKD
jgi:LPS-assembly lipoprotein